MKVTAIFALFIVLSVGTTAQELNTELVFEGAAADNGSRDEEKDRTPRANGSCGDNILWSFNDVNLTLSISGQGNMSCCNSYSTP